MIEFLWKLNVFGCFIAPSVQVSDTMPAEGSATAGGKKEKKVEFDWWVGCVNFGGYYAS
jgi:hypothetical protein